jgi:choline dehydrogenase
MTAHSARGGAQPDLQVFPSGPEPGEDGPTALLLAGLMKPRSRGELRLASPNPETAPAADPGYLRHPEDRKRMAAGARLARRLAMTPPLDRQLRDPVSPAAFTASTTCS